jgi:hypothetical protein
MTMLVERVAPELVGDKSTLPVRLQARASQSAHDTISPAEAALPTSASRTPYSAPEAEAGSPSESLLSGPSETAATLNFPYNAKLCINGHEYLKRQLAKRGVAFEPFDNGIKSCADPELAQRLCDGLSSTKIDQLLRKRLRRLPHRFRRAIAPPAIATSSPSCRPSSRSLRCSTSR